MRRLLGAALALTMAGPAILAGASATATATAATTAKKARITVTNDRGTSGADAGYRTKLTITGRDFQVIKGGFGGIYLMFGWVHDPGGGSWRPSRGGITGEDYRYVPDSEAAANQGYLKFIAFPGSSTEAEAQAVLSPAGRFTVALTVPGPTFRSVDRDGRAHDVDCRKVRCGVITIGAHGVKNANNETFTPVRFGDVYRRSPVGSSGQGEAPAPAVRTGAPVPTPSSESSASPPASTATATAPTAATAPKVTADRSTARAGNVLAFTGVGFRPGETVVGVLDDGAVGVGPLTAGSAGDVAGVLRLPRDVGAGTHELRLTGAVSGVRAGDRFPVRAPVRTAAAVPVAEARSGPRASLLFLVGAAILLALATGAMARRRLLRHRSAAS